MMKRVLFFFFLFVATTSIRAENCLFRWQTGVDKETGEKYYVFMLAPKAAMKIILNETRDHDLGVNYWAYIAELDGQGTVFNKDKIKLAESGPSGTAVTIDSGTITIEQASGIVRVALKIVDNRNISNFKGNGVYRTKSEGK